MKHIPNYDLSKTELVESNHKNEIVQSGVISEVSINNENSPKKRGMSAINHDVDLPFGIEHILTPLSDCTFRLSMPRSDPHRDDPHRSYMEGRSHACFWCTLVWAHTGGSGRERSALRGDEVF